MRVVEVSKNGRDWIKVGAYETSIVLDAVREAYRKLGFIVRTIPAPPLLRAEPMTTLELYRTAVAADDAFEAALQARGFTRWNWLRDYATDDLRTAYNAKLAADAALHAAYARLNEIRRAAHCLD